MRFVTILTIALALVLSAFSPHEAKGVAASDTEMRYVCLNWLSYILYYQGGWAGDTLTPQIADSHDVIEIVEEDTLHLGRSFDISPSGHVVVPILKELSPVKTYSEVYGLDVGDSVGFPQLLREFLYAWYVYFDTVGGGRGTAAPHWTYLTDNPDSFKVRLDNDEFDPMETVGPLLTTLWHQHSPYNDSCPLYDSVRCSAGCVPIAAAQVMNYHEWPITGVGSHCYLYPTLVDTLCATFSDPYDWDNMPDTCDSLCWPECPPCSPEESTAVAELCYEVGVAFETRYKPGGSGANEFLTLTILPEYFRYDSTIFRVSHKNYDATEWFDLIRPQVNAYRPMMYAYWRRLEGSVVSGHEIVCDGWRIAGGLNQYHMNYGYGDDQTRWWSVDSLPYYEDIFSEYLIGNIVPIQDFSGELPDSLPPGIYNIVDTIYVSSGDTARVYAGTTFRFAGPYPLNIYGILLAEGVDGAPVTFTTDIVTNPDRWRGLRFYSDSDSSRLAYCVIQYASQPGGDGGGVYCESASPTFTKCTVRNNSASNNGGGVSCSYSSLVFTNCTISSNSAGDDGGGVYSYNSSQIFTNCIITGNSANGSGGGVRCHCPLVRGCQPSFINCAISSNTTNGSGGGVSCYEASPTFINCILSGNSAIGSGGGLVCGYFSAPKCSSCTIVGNSADGDGGGVYCGYWSSAIFNSTIIAFSEGAGIYFTTNVTSSTIEYCDFFNSVNFEGDVPTDLGVLSDANANGDSCDTYMNILLPPLFIDRDEDFHLDEYSRCIGAAQTGGPDDDIEGNPRPNPPWCLPDIGAYESDSCAPRPPLCGSLSGTLGPDTFRVGCTISVESGSSLQIMPGATFIFDGFYAFNIYGTLLAEGTESDSIVFTADTLAIPWDPYRWAGLRFYFGSSNSQLAHCVIENGLASIISPTTKGGGIRFSNCSPTIENCQIRNCSADYGGGIYSYNMANPSIKYCTISGNHAENGGGIYCWNLSDSIVSCDISGNIATIRGGGMYCTNSSTTIDNCSIRDNMSSYGGGVYCSQSNPRFKNCTISGNRPCRAPSLRSLGGGLYCDYWSNPELDACLITDNWADGNGGGVYCTGDFCSPTFTNCIISGDSADENGGGVYCENNSGPSFEFCTFSGNSAGGNGGGVYTKDSSPAFNSTIVAFSEGEGIYFENSDGSTIEYCDFWNDVNFGGDPPYDPCDEDTVNANGDSCDANFNICLDPSFMNSTDGDFHLLDTSHCIDATDPTVACTTDFDGNRRPNPPGTLPDIGAYEYWASCPIDSLVIWIVNGNAVLWWPPADCPRIEKTYWYGIYGSSSPFGEGELIGTTWSMTDTTWTDMQTSSRPSPYFYHVQTGPRAVTSPPGLRASSKPRSTVVKRSDSPRRRR